MSDSSPSPGPARRRFDFAMSSSDDESPVKGRAPQPQPAATAKPASPAAPVPPATATATPHEAPAASGPAVVAGASLAAMMDAASTPTFSSGGDESDDDLDLPGQRSAAKVKPDAPHDGDSVVANVPAVSTVEPPVVAATPPIASELQEEPTAAAAAVVPATDATTPPRSRRHSIHLSSSSSSSSSSSAPSPIRKPADTTAASAAGPDHGLTPGTMQRELQQMSSVSDAASPAPAADSGSFTLAATARAAEPEEAPSAAEPESGPEPEEDALELASSAAASSPADSPLAPVRQTMKPAVSEDSTSSLAESTPAPSPEKRPPPTAVLVPKDTARPAERPPTAGAAPSRGSLPSLSQASTDAGFRPNHASNLRRATSVPKRKQEETPPAPVPHTTKYPSSAAQEENGVTAGEQQGPKSRVDHMYKWAQARDAKREQAAAELRRREEERRSKEATSCTFKPSITRYAAQQPTRGGGYAANHAQLRRQREEEAAEALRHELHGRPTINAVSDAIFRRKQAENKHRNAYVIDRLDHDLEVREKRVRDQAQVFDEEQQRTMVGSRQPPVSSREADRRARQQWEWDARRQEAVAKLREIKESEHLVAGGGQVRGTRVANTDDVVERLFRPRSESPLEALANEGLVADEFTPYVSDVSDSLAAHAKLRCLKSWFEFLAGAEVDAVLSVQAAVASSQRPEASQILKLLARSLHTHAAVEGMTLDEFVDFAAELEAVYGPQQWCTQGPTRRGCSAAEPAAKNTFRPQVSKQSADIVARTRPARQRHADPALRLYDERLAIERRRANLRAEVEELERPSFRPATVPYAGIPPADINRQPALVSPSRSALHRQRHSGRAAAAASSLEPDVDIIDAIEAHRRSWEAAQQEDELSPHQDSRRGDASVPPYGRSRGEASYLGADGRRLPEALVDESTVQTVALEASGAGAAGDDEAHEDPEPHVGAPSPSRRPDSVPHTSSESEARARSTSRATDTTAISAQPTDASMRDGSGSASRARTDRSAMSAVSSKARERPFATSNEFLLRVEQCRPRSVHDVAARDIGAVPEHDRKALHAIGRDMAAQQGEELARMFAMAQQKGRPTAAAKTKRAPVAATSRR